jgi:hypothetical protein
MAKAAQADAGRLCCLYLEIESQMLTTAGRAISIAVSIDWSRPTHSRTASTP